MEKHNSVRLEALLDKSGNKVSQGFDHPASITEDQMRRILASIQTVEPPNVVSKLILKAKTEAKPAFNTEEVEFLAIPFAAAFAEATPDERVDFFLHNKRRFSLSTSSGIAFVKNGRMHFILGRYKLLNEPGKPDIDVGGNPLPKTNDQDFYIEAGPYQEIVGLKTAPGSKDTVYENRWVAISYKDLLESPIKVTAPSPAVTAPSQTVTAPSPAVTAPSPTVTAPAETTAPQPPSKTSSEILEEKLRTLKRLQQGGLITEQEYNQKKQELLRSF
jgi:hypothetical protein